MVRSLTLHEQPGIKIHKKMQIFKIKHLLNVREIFCTKFRNERKPREFTTLYTLIHLIFY